MAEKLVIIGNGMAPGRMLEKLFELAPGRFDVTIFNAEPRVNYDRIMLSPVLAGEKSFDDIVIHGDAWYIAHGILLYKGCKIVAIDRDARTVTAANGVVASYDHLVIATGSVPFILPVPGNTLAGVLTYRDLDDVNAMMIAAKSRGRAVVIGGGLLGLEAAAGLNEQGMDVTVVHVMPSLMERQLDAAGGAYLAAALRARGIKVLVNANTKQILGDRRATGVELSDGTVVPADLVIMAVGIRPNATLARDAGLAVNRGIVTDAGMQTSDPAIFALGECAEVEGQCYGLVAPLYDMANVLAARLAGDHSARFVPAVTPTRLKVTGINVYSAGDFAAGDDREDIVLRDESAGVYKRVVLREGRVVGTVLYGETSDGPWFSELMQGGASANDLRDTLIFGRSFAGGVPLDPYGGRCSLAG
jgi:nitrite reductase (NADH) large subunit